MPLWLQTIIRTMLKGAIGALIIWLVMDIALTSVLFVAVVYAFLIGLLALAWPS
jgi:hypothetical protein